MLLLIILITVIVVPLVLRVLSRHMDGRWFRRAVIAILICYAALVLYMTLGSRSYYANVRLVLDPFYVYRRLIRALKVAYSSGGWQAALSRLVRNSWVVDNIVPNILLLLPLGYLLPAIGTCRVDAHSESIAARNRGSWLICRWYGVLLVGLLASALIETLQLVLHLGVFDVADLMHNTVGTLIGYWLYWIMIRKGLQQMQ